MESFALSTLLFGIIFFAGNNGIVAGSIQSAPSPNMTCDSEITIILTSDDFQRLSISNASVAEVYITAKRTSPDKVPSECKPTTRTDSSITFQFHHTKCTPLITNDTINYYFTYVVWNNPRDTSHVISRYELSSQTMTCIIPHIFILHASDFHANIRELEHDEVGAAGLFLPSLKLYSNSEYTHELTAGATVFLNEEIFVEVRENSVTLDGMYVQLEKCFATKEIGDSVQYPFVNDRCPVRTGNLVNTTISLTSGDGQAANFVFRSFEWNNVKAGGEQLIFVTCYVKLCDTDVDNCTIACDPAGIGRRRRTADTAGDDDAGNLYSVFGGPVAVKRKDEEYKSPCSEENGGCSDTCVSRGTEWFCICDEGSTLLKDGKTCKGLVKQEYVNEAAEIAQGLALFGVLLTAILLCFFVWARHFKLSMVEAKTDVA